MERIKTGIPGMDKILGGGIPETQLALLTGTSGTGKTTFCCQFMHEGIKRFNEKGVYLSFEEPAASIKENVREFGWDFSSLEKTGRFSFIKYDPYHIEDVFDILESNIRETKATRVVIDSISALGLHVKDDAELRKMIFDLSMILRKLSCTSLIVSEIVPGTSGLSRYGVEEFVADTVIVLYYERLQSTFSRAVQIWKVRGSSHSEKLHPYSITDKGIVVYPDEEAFIKR
jgi:KaiC/GvpD/RAD55 family RecA-like ATPase